MTMTSNFHRGLNITRRHFLGTCQVGLGGLALALLAEREKASAQAPPNPMAPRPPHFPPKVKNVTYQNLPGFIVLVSSGVFPSAGNSDWSNGFLPSVYQGVQCRSQGDPVLYVSNPRGMDSAMRRQSLDALRDLNEMQAAELGNPETQTRIA